MTRNGQRGQAYDTPQFLPASIVWRLLYSGSRTFFEVKHGLSNDRKLCSIVLSWIRIANHKRDDRKRCRSADPRVLA